MSLINLRIKKDKLSDEFGDDSLTYFNTKIILDPLHGQVLPQRAELVINVLVVGALLVPLGFQHAEGLHQHRLRAHLARIGCLGQSEVRLLNSHARSFDAGMFGILVQAHLTIIKGRWANSRSEGLATIET